jgi:hypothetical protein
MNAMQAARRFIKMRHRPIPQPTLRAVFMPLSCSSFYLQSAEDSALHPLYVGRVPDLCFRETATGYKGEIHGSLIGGS